jgi:hypothetical protein
MGGDYGRKKNSIVVVWRLCVMVSNFHFFTITMSMDGGRRENPCCKNKQLEHGSFEYG